MKHLGRLLLLLAILIIPPKIYRDVIDILKNNLEQINESTHTE